MADPIINPMVMTADQINQAFKACGDSVNLINAIVANPNATDVSGNPVYKTKDDPDAKLIMKRNVDHLNIQIAKDWYIADTTARTAPADKASITAAIASGTTFLNS